ncbi:cysteine-rich repeat secretory protein 55-like [Phalaenopsis equestris]|uniref:cysteine-rich repeat secretory protein 55-like n=1 Tax=Phalaenopsis equestris TaxID=78828 RepID=UPI0009E2A811|nr:cysteine-rich repeat secretory protein 55-like [Phalaenopsis equestris]
MEVALAKGFMSSIFSSSQNGSILYGLAHQAQAYILYDPCFLRYDVVNFLGYWTISGAEYFLFSKKEAQTSSIFVPAVKLMVGKLKTMVVAGSETNLFAKALASNITGLDGVSIYGMAQCTGDMKKSTCIECLTYIEDLLPSKCGDKSGCRFFYNSCFVRYEIYDFFTSKSR